MRRQSVWRERITPMHILRIFGRHRANWLRLGLCSGRQRRCNRPALAASASQGCGDGQQYDEGQYADDLFGEHMRLFLKKDFGSIPKR